MEAARARGSEQAETRMSPLEAATGARCRGGKVLGAPAPMGGTGVAATPAPEEPGRVVGLANSSPGGAGAA